MDHTPELPPHLQKKLLSAADVNDDIGDVFCPQLPPHMKKTPQNDEFCPELPSHLQKKTPDNDEFCPELPSHLQKKAHNNDEFCPELPSHLRKKTDNNDFCPELPAHLQKIKSVENDEEFCPQLPPHLKNAQNNYVEDDFCPQLPSHIKNHKESFKKDFSSRPPHLEKIAKDDEAESDSDEFCPALPPHLLNRKDQPRILGPAFPPQNYKANISKNATVRDDDDAATDAYVYGPLPASKPVDMDQYIEDTFERRTNAMKDKLSGKKCDGPPVRETWMLELPENKPLFSGLGLQARQFARKAKMDRGDTSVWTDTPADKERKAQRAAERAAAAGGEEEAGVEELPIESAAAHARDAKLQEEVDRYNASKRPAPLVDTHTAQKKARGDDQSVTGVGRDRKPFSREDDLHVNKFDESQRSTIMMKAKQLNDRFSSSKSSKFL